MVNNIQNGQLSNLTQVFTNTEIVKTESTTNVATVNEILLGQNIVTASDKEGANNASAATSGDKPELVAPNQEQVEYGKQELYGTSSAILNILSLMMNSLEASRKASATARSVSTAQQNASEVASFQQIDTMNEMASNIREGAIVNGLVGGVGAGLSATGLVGGLKKAKLAKNADNVSDALGRGKLGQKLHDTRLNHLHKKLDKSAGSKADKLREQIRKLESKSPMDKTSKYELMEAIMQQGTGITGAAQNTYNNVNQAENKNMEADAQTSATISERDKTDRSKSESLRDDMKRSTDSLMKTLADVLNALSQSASASVRV